MDPPQPSNCYLLQKRKATLLRKVARDAKRETPPTQNQLEKINQVSKCTAHRILHKNLLLKTFKNTNTVERQTFLGKITARKPYRDNLDFGITRVVNIDIPDKSPDASQMELFGFGDLKQAILKRKTNTLKGFCKLLDDEWSEFTPGKCI